MLNIAHRGFKSKFPENTKIAFEKAIDVGADGVEFDVHLTKDREVVIIHDERLERTSDGKGLVKDFTLSELKKLNMSKLYDNVKTQEILTLREYFQMVKDLDFITNVELKNSIYDYEGIEKEVNNIIKEFDLERRVIISSFNHDSIIRFKNLNDRIKCGLLVDCKLYKPWEYMKKMEVEYYHPSAYLVDEELVYNLKNEGVLVNVWFGNEPHSFKRLINLDINGIITDYPDEINKILKD